MSGLEVIQGQGGRKTKAGPMTAETGKIGRRDGVKQKRDGVETDS